MDSKEEEWAREQFVNFSVHVIILCTLLWETGLIVAIEGRTKFNLTVSKSSKCLPRTGSFFFDSHSKEKHVECKLLRGPASRRHTNSNHFFLLPSSSASSFKAQNPRPKSEKYAPKPTRLGTVDNLCQSGSSIVYPFWCSSNSSIRAYKSARWVEFSFTCSNASKGRQIRIPVTFSSRAHREEGGQTHESLGFVLLQKYVGRSAMGKPPCVFWWFRKPFRH